MTLLAFMILAALAVSGFLLNRSAALAIQAGGTRTHSLAYFHGLYALLSVLVPVFVVICVYLVLKTPVINGMVIGGLPDGVLDDMSAGQVDLVLATIQSITRGQTFGTPPDWQLAAAERLTSLYAGADLLMVVVVAALSAVILFFVRRQVAAEFRARQAAERIVHGLMVACSLVAILTTVGIVFALVYEAYRFFEMVPVMDFLFGTRWEPQIPIRADQVAAVGAFGWLPVILGTVVIGTVAMLIATPIGLLTAIYLNEFAPKSVRAVVKPVLEILSGVPTVVYGFFAILVVAPALRGTGADLGIAVSSNTALAAGGVMGIMLIPFISSFADDALTAVPRSLRDGSLALGATRGETMLKVLFPAAIPGIVGGILLAVSRAIGETMIVVMAAGLIARMTINPLDSVTTVTVQIVTLLIGDTAFDNPKTLAAFALGLMLFILTLGINILALRIVRKYREIYD
ncbi:phosphate ABC transporter permease subunit PstC [Roseicyclus mahoneyensis]|uniref:Phosphate transport system permease protein n=1 Tax=Roseicyclus mahoneyensis TaxID=164332 RepID=A0A316GDT6_9RHOB|nr:phosphate ABC transporter permease subunit PstC [Roseicyclus mahoneyensis]PWK59141.1 phosphate ABC transporter membrane protein 1 (PhoT family) [Roseicyclus mahoneyensis]